MIKEIKIDNVQKRVKKAQMQLETSLATSMIQQIEIAGKNGYMSRVYNNYLFSPQYTKKTNASVKP
jgi:hypothetical protein